jgi:hypothetical protein
MRRRLPLAVGCRASGSGRLSGHEAVAAWRIVLGVNMTGRARRAAWFTATVVLALVTGAAVAHVNATLVLLGIAALAAALVMLRRPGSASPLLLLAAIPFVRPNIFGERYSPLALGLSACAALLAVVADSRSTADHGATHIVPTPVWVILSYLWLLLLATLNPNLPARPIWQGLVLTGGFLLAALMVLRSPQRRLLVARGFATIIALCCASYVVTLLWWVAAGTGTGLLTDFPVGALSKPQPVFFPFTTTAGLQTIHGVTLPRFVGIGREPGWMAMYCVFAYFLMPLIGWRKRWARVPLVVGMLGTLSTGGFAVFVGVWVIEHLHRSHPELHPLDAFARQALGLVGLVAAAWIAITAPGVGVQAKMNLNPASYSDRAVAATDGLRALAHVQMLGSGVGSAINLIASVAVAGIPYALCILGAVLWPRIGHPSKHLTTALVAVLLATLLVSQPPSDSTWFYLLVMLAYSVPLAAEVDAENQTFRASPSRTRKPARRTVSRIGVVDVHAVARHP